MKFSYCLIVLGLIATLSVSAEEIKEDNGSNQSSMADKTALTARDRFVLPKIFDFARYKELFKKSYNSIVEELARQKLFLGRAFNAVITMVKYKYEKLDYHLGINHFSDQTPHELKKGLLSADQIRDRLSKAKYSNDELDKHNESTNGEEELPAATIDDIVQVVDELKQHKDEPGYKEIAEEFEHAESKVRSKRDTETSHITTRKISMDDLMPKESDILGAKNVKIERVPSNNPSYVPLDLTSYGAEDPQGGVSSMSSGLINMINKVPGSQIVSSIVKKATGAFSSSSKKSASQMAPDSIRVDHRLSGCFNEPRNQQNCGSCYAFATIAFFEWLYCVQTGRRVEFSEQYLVDCGNYAGLEGCDGGSEDASAEFVHKFGLQLRSDYPYIMREEQCPFGPDNLVKETGYIRMKSTGYKFVKTADLDEYLNKRPIMFGIRVNDDFHFYSGGVHDDIGCSPDEAHLMLLVGDGIQDGISYYVMRNSYSPAWGERGYYKVSKEALRRCATDPYGGISTGSFSPSGRTTINPLFNKALISEKKYLKPSSDSDAQEVRRASLAPNFQ